MSELTQMEYSTATGCTFVILSDERSEESKDPYGRKQFSNLSVCRAATLESCHYRGPSLRSG